MELYRQISIFYIPGDDSIKNDQKVSDELNEKIKVWAIDIHLKTNYRIINITQTVLPNPSWTVGTPKIMVTAHIAYQSITNK